LMLINEFRNAACEGKLMNGNCRIFLLNDLSSAFDRVSISLLLHAIFVVVRTDQPERFLRTIFTMSSKVKIVVTVNGISVIIGKDAGVPQGNPLAPLLFIILMEYARMMTKRQFRPLVNVRLKDITVSLPFEVDYADDSNRVVDGLSESQPMVDHIMDVLKAVDQNPNNKKIRVLGLLYSEGHGIVTFDPGLFSTGSDGERFKIQAIKGGEFFRLNGVLVNSHGSFKGTATEDGSVELLEKRDSDTIKNIYLSDYPIPAKLEALRTVADKQSEYLFSNVWISTKNLKKLDKLERKTVRSFFGFNLPNAYIKGELTLGLREERHVILYLTSFLKKLTSHDPRVKLLARLVIESHPVRKTWKLIGPLDPPFFGWDRIPAKEGGGNGVREMGTRLAQIARNLGVGLSLEDGKLSVTLLRDEIFRPLVNIGKLLKSLTKQVEISWLKDLETRQSLDQKKTPAPLFSISWGDAGMVSSYRKQETAFLKSRFFSDYSIEILVGLRILLWPTKVRDQVYSKRAVVGRCRCGALQTTTHILNLSSINLGHSLELRSFPTLRHDEWVSTIIKSILETQSGWEIVRGQGCQGSDSFENLDRSLSTSLLRKALKKSRDGKIHWKPDLILGKKTKGSIKFYLLDLCGGSPERLFVENFLFKFLQKMSPENDVDFTFEGELTIVGLKNLSELSGISLDELQTLLKTFKFFKTVRYAQRYKPLKKLLEKLVKREPEYTKLKQKVSILALPVGVTGTIPSFSVKILKNFLDKKQLPGVLKSLRITTWNFAILIYKAWRKEL
jgi:hypothetical protein